MYLWQYLFLTFCHTVWSKVFTLIKDDNCTCVLTQETVYSGVYLDFPRQGFKRVLKEVTIDLDDEWNLTEVGFFNYCPVTDQRWESFISAIDTSLEVAKLKSFSFSIYTDSVINFAVRSKKYVDAKSFTLPNTLSTVGNHQWFHYTIKVKNDGVDIYSEHGKFITSVKTTFPPYAVTADNAFLKVHKYNFSYSQSVTSGEPSTYKIFLKEPCLTMFVSVDDGCYLQVALQSESNALFVKNVAGFNRKDSLKKWKRLEIQVNFTQNAFLTFVRGRYDGKTHGYWAIDKIQYCKSIETFSVNDYQKNSNSYCKALTDEYRVKDNNFLNNPGCLEKNCNVNCSFVLGEKYPFCKNHQICLDNKCHCAWGFEGSLCADACREGYWGANCRLTCKQECEECNHVKGCIKCKEGFSLSESFTNQCRNSTITVNNTDAVKIVEPTSELATTTDNGEPFSEFTFPTFITNTEPNLTTSLTPKIVVSLEKEIKLYFSFINNTYTRISIKIFTKESVKEQNVTLQGFEKELNFSISVEYMQNYKITVEQEINQLETFEVKIYATVLSPYEKFSSKPFVEVCIDKCLLLIPPPHNYIDMKNTVFFVTKDQEIKNEQLTRVYNLNKNRTVGKILGNEEWIVEPNITTNGIELEIGVTQDRAVSVKNQTYFIYLIFNTTKELVAYQISFKESKNLIEEHFVLIVAASVSVVISGTTILFGIYIWNKFVSPEIDSNTKTESIPLQNILEEHDSTTDIDKEDFIYVLNQKLLLNLLESEFLSIPMSHTKTSWHGQRNQNINKNRKKDGRINIPYDYNRVLLRELNGVGKEDYINASYINGYDRPKAYIAAPGPKFFTVKDFWRMIWQEEIKLIVMATNFIENQKRMCAEYWPQRINTIYECGKLKIKLIEEENYEYYDTRILEIRYRTFTREIRHLHLKWNSEELMYPNNLMPVVKRIRSAYRNGVSPILIHSGFGTSRSGTLILCDLVLQKLKVRNKVNFYVIATNLIKQRHNIVKTPQDYILAHLTVAEFIMEKCSPFRSVTTQDVEPVLLTEQLKYLALLNEHDKIIRSWKPQGIVEHGSAFVDGYGHYRKYLVTQQPTKNDIVSQFWNMVVNKSISHIIFLDKFQENLTLWSHSTCQFSDVNIEVEYVRFMQKEHYNVTELLLCLYLKGTTIRKTQQEIFVYQLYKCEKSATDFVGHFISLICDITEVESNSPIIVSCNDGISVSGYFVVLSYIIEKYKKEGKIDVCNAIRTARRNGTNFINDTKQLKFIYDCLYDFLEKKVYTSIE